LAAGLLTSAFANVGRSGKIAIREVDDKSRFGHGKRLVVRLIPGVNPAAEPDPSIGRPSHPSRPKLDEPGPKNIVWNRFGNDIAEPMALVR
jgi:hypothetical protein